MLQVAKLFTGVKCVEIVDAMDGLWKTFKLYVIYHFSNCITLTLFAEDQYFKISLLTCENTVKFNKGHNVLLQFEIIAKFKEGLIFQKWRT